MKITLSTLALVASVFMLQACGGGGLAGDSKDSTDPLIPEPVVDDGSDRPRPSENTPVLKADGWQLKDVAGTPVLLRGINVNYSDNALERINNIVPVSEVGSNVVRLQLSKTTKAAELEGALVEVASANMVALLTLVDDDLTCKDDADLLDQMVNSLWLGDWLPVIAQDRFQAHLMVSIAHQWGPKNIFTENTVGYGDYLEAHKLAIREFRKAGLKFPLVIDAAGCGEDYYSFTAGRARELKAADTQTNLVLSVQAFGESWNSDDRIRTAITKLNKTNMPILMGGFGGSGVGVAPVDHQSIMKKGAGDTGLAFNIPWQSDDDKVAYSMALDQSLFLRGASVRADIYMPKAYVDDGKLGVVLYLKDTAGHYASAGWNQANTMQFDAWNKLNFKLTSVDYLKDLGAYVEDGFDLASVAKIGFELVANGKPADVKAPLIIDNFTVYPGIPPVYKADFSSDNQEWENHWGPFTVGAADGNLTLLPTGSGDGGVDLQGWKAPSLYDIPLDKPIEVTIRLYVPESYGSQGDAWLKLFGQFGSDWSVWKDVAAQNLSTMQTGAWNLVKFDVDFSDASVPQAFGMQIGGFSGAQAEPLLIDFIEINDPNKKNTKIINAQQLGSSFDGDADSYGIIWDKMATASVVDGALEVTNTNTSGDADVAVGKGDINSKSLNLEGPVTIKAKVFIPESLAGNEDFYFNFFMQDSNWHHFSFPTMNIGQFTPGQWTDVEIVEDAFDETFNRKGNLQHFGFQFGGPGVNATIKIDDLQIWGNVEVEDAQPILVQNFDTAESVDTFAFDYASGLDESSLTANNAKFWGVSTLPFGWIANSWIGSEGFDMCYSESAVDLTPRGDEIVNGAKGIAETSVKANF